MNAKELTLIGQEFIQFGNTLILNAAIIATKNKTVKNKTKKIAAVQLLTKDWTVKRGPGRPRKNA